MIRVVETPQLGSGASDASGDRGRRVVCSIAQGARSGDLLLRVAPFAALLDPSLWPTHCHSCFRSAEETTTPLSRCGRCRTVFYCSRACQQQDWKPDHCVECARLTQLTSLRLQASQISDVLLLGRVVRRVASAVSSEPGSEQVYSPLELTWNDLDYTQETELLAVLMQKLGLVEGESTTTSVHHLQRMLSRFQNNNFAISDARLRPVGAGCFPLAAMVNHSCEPNAVITYDLRTHEIEFRAIRAIAPEEEITHAYVDMALPRTQRQERIQSRYHFSCACPRCSSPLDDSSNDRFLDADVDGVAENEWSQSRRQQVDDLVAQLFASGSGIIPTLSAAKKALSVQDSTLHALNTQRLSTLALILNLQVEDPTTIGDAVATGEEILRVYEQVYPANHPMVGLHSFTMGDLCMAHQMPSRAHEHFTKAMTILRRTHGETHEFVRSLCDRLEQQ